MPPPPPPTPPPNLRTLVHQKYTTALASSDLLFSPTSLTTISVSNIPFQLRHCPALSQKPSTSHSSTQPTSTQPTNSTTPPPPTATATATKPDPFASPPTSLLITHLPPDHPNPTHVLVLNKYPVIPSHFILATTAFKPQTHLLEPEDLSATFACLEAWERREGTGGAGEGGVRSGGDGSGPGPGTGATGGEKEKRLFAFFNSGPHSGASQAHRHLQFVPVEEMAGQRGDGDGDEAGWRVLVDWMVDADATPGVGIRPESHDCRDPLTLHHLPHLPFTHFAARIPPSPSPTQLHALYKNLYATALATCQRYAAQHPDEATTIINDKENRDADDDEDGEAAVISYNLALTTSCMAICPRRSEGAMVKGKEGRVLGPVAVNGTVLGGTVMVRTGEEWDALRGGGGGGGGRLLEEVLEAVGIPRVYGVGLGSVDGRL